MTVISPTRLAVASLRYYWRTDAAVVCGQAAAVAVLAGSLLVGHSVRASLSSIASSRTGRADTVIAAEQPFTAALADRLRDAAPLAQENAAVAAVFSLSGSVLHDGSGRRANGVQVYGVDDAFFKLHGVEAAAIGRSDVLVSADLGSELAAADGDTLVLRIVRPTDIPADSMHGRRDDTGRSIRLTARGVLPRARMGDFSLMPQQGPVRAAFMSLARLQRDIAQPDRANLLLISAAAGTSNGGDVATRARAALDMSLQPADLGLRAEMIAAAEASAGAATPTSSAAIVETASGLMPDAVARAVTDSATHAGLTSTGVMTWLANRMTVNGRTVPYSLIAAIDQASVEGVNLAHTTGASESSPIALTEWAAKDLGAHAGDTLELEYYQWTDAGTLETREASFRVAGTVPMRGLAIDRRLAPDYPGISDAEGLGEWDPPFPVDLKLVRPIDEAFWDQHKTSPKAFIQLAAGQALWRSRHGQLSSIRLSGPSGSLSADSIDRVLTDATRAVDRASIGITTIDVRSQNAAASAGATDFGAYFSYFSFFLVVSALLLSALFFRLSVEQRLPQLGVLRAIGLPLPLIRRVWLIEAAVVAAVGMAAGLVLAVGWAALMMFGLRTWWTGAVGTTLLALHVDIVSLVAGAVGASLAGLTATAWTVRGLARRSPRRLISGSDGEGARTGKRSRRTAIVALVSLGSAALLSALAGADIIAGEGAFFGAGTLVLVGGLSLMARSLGTGRTRASIRSLALQNASWRPGRSLTCAGLVASAVFLLIAVDAFRKTATSETGRASGSGGFSVMAESAVPIVHDPGTVEGREALGLRQTTTDAAFDGAEITPMRLRPGDDTSCLSLYVPTRPRILGVSARFVEANRFRFGATIASSDQDRANPWRLLGPPDAAGVVPAIVDATSLQYVLHASVGDLITIDADTARPVTLRIVGALADSVLQSEVMIAEEAFTLLFPMITGYRVLLAEAAAPNAPSPARLATLLEERLAPFGVDAVETSAKIDAFHRVENTYLSTFQALGALGLLLGCVGLAAVIARNVLERRRELALLGAFGFTGQQLRTLVTLEHLALVGAGLAIGVVAALIAVAPLSGGISAAQAGRTFVWLAGVIAMTFVVTAAATRQVRRLPIVSSLRSE